VLRLSRLRNINDIEAIVNNPGPVLGQRVWKARGAACLLERHVYLGEHYSFHTNVLQITSEISGQASWRVLLISEFWEGKLGETISFNKVAKIDGGKIYRLVEVDKRKS